MWWHCERCGKGGGTAGEYQVDEEGGEVVVDIEVEIDLDSLLEA